MQLQQLANGIAAYGGNSNTISGNLIVDTGINEGGGITVAQRFTSTPVGLYTVQNNTLIRDGDLDDNWQFGDGAIWFDAQQATIAGPINVTNALIEQSPFEAIQFIQGTVNGLNFNNVSIVGTGTFAIQDQTGASVSFTNVTATGVAQANLGNSPSYTCDSGSFKITDDGGNSGILPATCTTTKPTPVYPPYPGTTVQVTPGSLAFGSVTTGSTSAAQTVAVSNPTATAAAVSSITVSLGVICRDQQRVRGFVDRHGERQLHRERHLVTPTATPSSADRQHSRSTSQAGSPARWLSPAAAPRPDRP